jgi:hypothetical protein
MGKVQHHLIKSLCCSRLLLNVFVPIIEEEAGISQPFLMCIILPIRYQCGNTFYAHHGGASRQRQDKIAMQQNRSNNRSLG